MSPIMSALEDAYEDILAKAQRGLGLKQLDLLERSGLSMMEIEAALKGTFEEGAAQRLGEILNLNPEALIAIGKGSYQPSVELPKGVKIFTTRAPVPGYEEMTVNAYLVFDPESKEAALFDTGTSLDAIVEYVDKESIRVTQVVFTHTHPDHVEALPQAQEHFAKARFLSPEAEPLNGVEPIRPENRFSIGKLQVQAWLTPGHSPGGTSYVIDGLSKPVAVVGDAIFAGSIGGVPHEMYPEALQSIRRHILSLPPETILLPGHKSPTSVGQELQHNPFFPATSD